MSIDIKTLRIGNAVLFCDKRHKVTAIDSLNNNIGIEQYILSSDGVKHPIGHTVESFSPIPITETLLSELGFEKHVGSVVYDYVKDNEVFVTELSDNRYRFEISTLDCVNHGNIIARYLHELENFYYHVFGKELVEG